MEIMYQQTFKMNRRWVSHERRRKPY